MAVLLGHGRRGELDQGEGTDCVHHRDRSRPHHHQPAALQAQGLYQTNHNICTIDNKAKVILKKKISPKSFLEFILRNKYTVSNVSPKLFLVLFMH